MQRAVGPYKAWTHRRWRLMAHAEAATCGEPQGQPRANGVDPPMQVRDGLLSIVSGGSNGSGDNLFAATDSLDRLDWFWYSPVTLCQHHGVVLATSQGPEYCRCSGSGADNRAWNGNSSNTTGL
ncbi:hypothetical protein Vafri_15065 [Volvox africanus]|nr:hypothetical protein Vafri_15065 [Volvox africanus]